MTRSARPRAVAVRRRALGAPQQAPWWTARAGAPAAWWGDPLTLSPALARAVGLVASTVGALPVVAVDAQGRPLASQPLLVSDPCPGVPRVEAFTACLTDLLVHGNAMFVVDRGAGWADPVLVPVPSSDVGVVADPRTGRREYLVGDLRLDEADVLHLAVNRPPGALRGVGVLERFSTTVLARIAAENGYAADAFSGNGVPSVLVKVDKPEITQVETDAIKTRWAQSFARREPAVVSRMVDVVPLAWSPTDSDLVAARNLSDLDAARMVGIDPSWLGATVAGGSMTYANLSQQGRHLLLFTLQPYLVLLEDALSRLLPAGQAARLSRDELQRQEQPERYTAWESALRAGWMTVDEVRAAEGLPAMPGATQAPGPGGDPVSAAALGGTP